MKPHLLIVFLGLLWLASRTEAQSPYQAGDTVENFSLINRKTGSPMKLSDFEGKIVFLDFFAHWCPVCNAAAPQLDEGIYERFRHAGNTSGIPVVYVLCNLQSDTASRDRTGTDAFVKRFEGDVVVLQDTNRALQRRFTSAGGQPTFAIINGVTNSASHRPWELVYSLHGYTSPGRVQPVEAFQLAIDSVKPPVLAADPAVLAKARVQGAGSVTFELTGTPGRTYRIEQTPNLAQWELHSKVVATDAPLTVNIVGTLREGGFFFRAVSE